MCYSAAFDAHIVEQIIAMAQMHKEPLLAGIPQWCQINQPNAAQRKAHQFFHMEIPNTPLPKNADIYMFVAFGNQDCDYDKYRSIKGIQVLSSPFGYCDIIAENSGKDIGINAALKLFHQNSYIAFGDSDNDITMLKKARYAIVMGQGSDNAKAHADYITKPVYENGIAYAWEHCPLFDKHRWNQNNKL